MCDRQRATRSWLPTVARLAWRDWVALGEAVACLAFISLALRVAPTVALRLGRTDGRKCAGDDVRSVVEADRLWRLMAAVARRAPRRPTCLAQALAVGWNSLWLARPAFLPDERARRTFLACWVVAESRLRCASVCAWQMVGLGACLARMWRPNRWPGAYGTGICAAGAG